MHPLEATLIQQALDHLVALRGVLAVPFEARGDHEFTAAYAGLNALLKIGHLTQSGMGEAARRALLELERESAVLLRSQSEGVPAQD